MPKRLILLAAALFAILTGSHAQQPHALALTGDVAGAHDPSFIHAGATWYVFTTGRAADGGQLGIRCSADLTAWHNCGHVFDAIPTWIQQKSPGTKDLWAPDISFEHGEFRLYYAFSLFGRNTSGIALATNTTLDPTSPNYHWQDRGLVLESTAQDNFNAIDPNYIQTDTSHAWLAFGSFWTGIKLRALEPSTGQVSPTDTRLYALAERAHPLHPEATPPPSQQTVPQTVSDSSTESIPTSLPADWQAIEAPFLVHKDSFFYLFVSFDLCCRGARSTYHTVVGRSRSITGPFVDRAGTPMLQGGGTPLLVANQTWAGPGGESVQLGQHGEPDLIVFHAYDPHTGRPSLQISTLAWHDGWPTAALAQ